MRRGLLFAVIAIAGLTGCGGGGDRTAATQTPDPTSSPAIIRHASAQEREAMRTWFTSAASVIAASADSANGLSETVAENPDDSTGHENISVPAKLHESDIQDSKTISTPEGWDDVHSALNDVIGAVNTNVDTLQQAHDGDADAARRAPEEAGKVKQLFCSALALARTHYVAAGGRANDLALFYTSERGDWPCVLVNDPHPRRGTIVRKTVGIEAFEVFTGVGGQMADPTDESAANIIHDFGVRLTPGAPVTILEHRRSFDDGVPELCRSRVPNRTKTYWIACKDIAT